MELTQDVSILLRVAAAMLFGGVLGVEREMGKHAAGLRTHMLIAGAAALIVGLGDSVAEHFQQERYRAAARPGLSGGILGQPRLEHAGRRHRLLRLR